jgi:Flp pilus assembly protein TadG
MTDRVRGARRQDSSETGSILVLTALSMIVLLGIAALSVDISFMYDKRNRLQAAADAAAKSAAFELQRNSSISLSDLQTFANQQVSAHGFDPAGTTSVVVHHPPTLGSFSGQSGYVEVIVSEPTSTFFGRILSRTSMTPSARAVAGTSNNLACIITLAPPGSSPFSLAIGNSTSLNGCGVAAGGDLNAFNPNSTFNGTPIPSVGIVGSCTGTCGNCPTSISTGCMGRLTTGAPTPTDPLAGLAPPPQSGVGCPAGVAGTAATLSPGCYTSIATTVTHLNAGIYYVTGKLDVATNLTGTGVMIYLTGGGYISIGNHNALHVSAPTSGTYTGIAIFQDPADSNAFSVSNNTSLDVNGAIYMPGADVNINNSLSFINTNCTLFIAHSLNIRNGNGSMSNAGCATTFGGAAFLSVSIAE